MSTPEGNSPSNSEYPPQTLTPTQRQAFQRFLEARKEIHINLQEPISFTRLLVRDKPGMILAPLEMPGVIDYTPAVTIEQIVDAFDLAYTRCENGDLAVARSPWRLDLYTSTSDTSPGCVGVFLGYPERDIEHYLTSDPPYTEPADMVDDGVFNAHEIAYVVYLPQRNDDSIAGYRRAISEGKAVRATIETWAKQWKLPELADYSDWMFEQAVGEYRPSCP